MLYLFLWAKRSSQTIHFDCSSDEKIVRMHTYRRGLNAFPLAPSAWPALRYFANKDRWLTTRATLDVVALERDAKFIKWTTINSSFIFSRYHNNLSIVVGRHQADVRWVTAIDHFDESETETETRVPRTTNERKTIHSALITSAQGGSVPLRRGNAIYLTRLRCRTIGCGGGNEIRYTDGTAHRPILDDRRWRVAPSQPAELTPPTGPPFQSATTMSPCRQSSVRKWSVRTMNGSVAAPGRPTFRRVSRCVDLERARDAVTPLPRECLLGTVHKPCRRSVFAVLRPASSRRLDRDRVLPRSHIWTRGPVTGRSVRI